MMAVNESSGGLWILEELGMDRKYPDISSSLCNIVCKRFQVLRSGSNKKIEIEIIFGLAQKGFE